MTFKGNNSLNIKLFLDLILLNIIAVDSLRISIMIFKVITKNF